MKLYLTLETKSGSKVERVWAMFPDTHYPLTDIDMNIIVNEMADEVKEKVL